MLDRCRDVSLVGMHVVRNFYRLGPRNSTAVDLRGRGTDCEVPAGVHFSAFIPR
jgi:hypothetical protein